MDEALFASSLQRDEPEGATQNQCARDSDGDPNIKVLSVSSWFIVDHSVLVEFRRSRWLTILAYDRHDLRLRLTRPLNVAEHKTLVVAAGGHWNDAFLLRYQRIGFLRTDWNMCDTLPEGKMKIAINNQLNIHPQMVRHFTYWHTGII